MTVPTWMTPDVASLAESLRGQYALERELGRGGMGIVLLARDLRLDRNVAIKMLLPHLADDPGVRERFLREARIAASLYHPNIVPVHRADEMDGRVFFVMGAIAGESLAQSVRRNGAFLPGRLAPVITQVAHALHHGHIRGIVHRDVKAENILLDGATDRAVVTDFGIARIAESSPLTATGTILGSVLYMSPEQIADAAVDARSDLYSLGVVAFYALSGRFPFDGMSASATILAHVMTPAPPLRSAAPQVPPGVAAVIDRCLAKNPDERFPDCLALIEALRVAMDSESGGSFSVQPAGTQGDARTPELSGRVSELDANALWERAARLQADPEGLNEGREAERIAPRATESAIYPLSVVRESAREAGIDTQSIDRAFAERGLRSSGLSRRDSPDAPVRSSVTDGAVREIGPSPISPWSGGPSQIGFEARIEGELPGQDFDHLVEIIRNALGDLGSVTTLGRSLAWNSTDPRRRVQVTANIRKGRTVLVASERLNHLKSSVFGGGVGGFGGGFGSASIGVVMSTTANPLLAFGAAGLIMATAYGVSRTLYRTTVARREAELRALMERLSRSVVETIEDSEEVAGRLPRLPSR
jgi:serine/threonine-protein kinase